MRLFSILQPYWGASPNLNLYEASVSKTFVGSTHQDVQFYQFQCLAWSLDDVELAKSMRLMVSDNVLNAKS